MFGWKICGWKELTGWMDRWGGRGEGWRRLNGRNDWAPQGAWESGRGVERDERLGNTLAGLHGLLE